MKTVVLLVISNIFMTVAWYGHLKYDRKPLVWAVLVSWSVAFFEYIFQVPANRIGATEFSLTQLKIMQECITLFVFTVFAFFAFRERPRWNNFVSYACILAAVYFSFVH
jgi:uncharacterized protein (DUF486 family)